MVLLLENQIGGPMGRFSDSDVFFLLDRLRDGEHIGRIRIAEYIGIGEGSIRSLLTLLDEKRMISITKAGVRITDTGKELLDGLGIRSVDIFIPGYVLGAFQQGVVVKGAANKVFNGIEQRNCGIRAGGDGCTTWAMEGDVLNMLPDWNVDMENPELAKTIREKTDMKDGDVLIIGGGQSRHLAMMAAGAASLELV